MKIIDDDILKLELCGIGENISNTYKKVFFSKSGAKIFDTTYNEETDINILLGELELYFNKNITPILTKKREDSTKTTFVSIESSFRGTSGIKSHSDNISMVSVTGNGRIGEHTEALVTLKEGQYIIFFSNGRYTKKYICFKNIEGDIKEYSFSNEGKYCDMPDYKEALVSFGITELPE